MKQNMNSDEAVGEVEPATDEAGLRATCHHEINGKKTLAAHALIE
jgi:hypothetical protein